jgi:tetratricopeptide (TPR) repeat protein
LEQAASIRREIGERYGLSRSVNNLGTIKEREGDLENARQMFTEALSLSREINNKNTAAASLLNIAGIMSDEGKYGEAEKAIQESLAIARDIGDQQDVMGGLEELAEIRYRTGHLAEAQATGEESVAVAKKTGLKPYSAYGLLTLGDVAAARGDTSESHKRYQEALAVLSGTNEQLLAAQAMLGDGVVSFQEGHLAESDNTIRQAIEKFRIRKMADNEIVGRAMLGLVLVAEGKPGDAKIQVDSANQLAPKSQNRDSQLALAIANAKVLAAQGNRGGAVKTLVAKIQETKDRARLDLRYEARLALAEIEMSSGRTAAGRTHLIALQREAASKGFLLIAHKASTLGVAR